MSKQQADRRIRHHWSWELGEECQAVSLNVDAILFCDSANCESPSSSGPETLVAVTSYSETAEPLVAVRSYSKTIKQATTPTLSSVFMCCLDTVLNEIAFS